MSFVPTALRGKYGNGENHLKRNLISRKTKGMYRPKINISRFSPWNLSEQSVLYACQVTVHRTCFFVRIPEYNNI